ncbi:MAG: mandelate racemase/muconate lactonizing enzyme family protein [Verrucomicrobiae bacterium]|nr:mandelate racemase/muconate lactonizing enzyme family protein [Verrucomicrobiae bacterium]
MKITRIETFAVKAKPIDKKSYWGSRGWGSENRSPELSTEYPPPLRRRFIYSKTIDTVLVKLTTDDGLVGWGEAKAPVAPEATKQIIDLLLTDLVMGADPHDVVVLWERMYAGMRVRGHRAGFYLEAISGVDIALWDLIGKASGKPLYQLLGGCFRNPVRVYASGLPALSYDQPSEAFVKLAQDARDLKERGFTGLKMAIGRGIKGDLQSIRAVREAVGEDFMIYTDAAGVYDRAQAMQIGYELQEMGCMWFEMPIPPEDVAGYGEIAKALRIPISLDSLTSRFETAEFIRAGGLDVVLPDVCRAGGVTECRRIAEMADGFGLAFAPHISIGSAIHFAASAHLATAMPNTMTSEYWFGDNPLGDGILKEPLRFEHGCMYTPDKPGLGIEIDEAALHRVMQGG